MKNLLILLCGWSLLAAPPAAAAEPPSRSGNPAVPPVPRLLPTDTLAFLSIKDFDQTREDFANSSLARMLQDPQMRPFVSDVYATANQLFDQVAVALGFSLEELLSIPHGQLAVALVPGTPPPETDDEARDREPEAELTDAEIGRRLRRRRERINSFSVVAIIDAGESADEMVTLLDRVGLIFEDRGMIRSNDENQNGLVRYSRPRGGGDVEWLQRKSLFVIGIGRDTAARIGRLMDGDEPRSEDEEALESLAENPNFATVISRSMGAEDSEPQMTFYLDPTSLAKRIINRSGQSFFIMPIVQDLGLEKIRGVGGSFFRGGEVIEGTAHVHVVIDPPRDGFFGVLRPETVDPMPPNWVPAELSSYLTVQWDMEAAFENLARIVNRFAGPDRFEDFVPKPIEKRLDIDVREDLLAKVTGRYVGLGRYERPPTLNANARVDAIEFKDAAAANALLERLRQKLPREEMKPTTIAGTTAFQLGKTRPARPNLRAVTRFLWQMDNWLVFSDSSKFAELVVRTQGGVKSRLIDDEDFTLMSTELDGELEGSDPFMLSFRRDSEQLRWIYELIGADTTKAGLRKGAQKNPMMSAVADLMERNSLPDFDLVKQYFFVSGFYGYDEPGGIHLGAITLRPFD
ncbi:MAG: DUF3352 domain-containing protein [Planctomycetota bacterium]